MAKLVFWKILCLAPKKLAGKQKPQFISLPRWTVNLINRGRRRLLKIIRDLTAVFIFSVNLDSGSIIISYGSRISDPDNIGKWENIKILINLYAFHRKWRFGNINFSAYFIYFVKNCIVKRNFVGNFMSGWSLLPPAPLPSAVGRGGGGGGASRNLQLDAVKHVDNKKGRYLQVHEM